MILAEYLSDGTLVYAPSILNGTIWCRNGKPLCRNEVMFIAY